MVDNDLVEQVQIGNASTVTYYPVLISYGDNEEIFVQRCAPGSGTVTVTAGVAVFTADQTSLGIGSKLRIGSLPGSLDDVYEIATRTDDKNFTLTTRPTIGASVFFLIESATNLVEGTDYVLNASGVQTVVAVAATSILIIFRRTPVVQLLDLPTQGALDQQSIETALDKITRILQEHAAKIYGTGIANPAGGGALDFRDTSSFDDDAARALAVPTRIGQLAVQLDTDILFRGTGLGAGQWTPVLNPLNPTVANTAAVLASTAAYVGQTVISREDGSIWVAYGISAGNWRLAWTTHPSVYDRSPWLPSEVLKIENVARWSGYFSRRTVLETATVTVAQVGAGSLVCRLSLPSTVRTIGITDFTLTDVDRLEKASGSLTASLRGTLASAIWTGGIDPGERLEAEIISIGTAQSLTLTANSATAAISGGSAVLAMTGNRFTIPLFNDTFHVIANRYTGSGTGEVILSHPSPATATPADCFSNPRGFVLGVTGLALAAGVTIIPCSAFEASLAREGMQAVGPTVPPGTFVMTVTPGTPSFTLSRPLSGATAQVTLLDPHQPPMQRFTNISAAGAATTTAVPHVLGLKLGDTILGTNVAANTYISVAPSGTSLTWTPGLSNSITQFHISPPIRTATGTAANNVVTLNNAIGILIGRKVIGPGVAEDSWVTELNAPDVTLSRQLLKDITTEALTFTREVCRHEAATLAGSPNITLGYAVTDTDIEAGQYVTGPGVPGGTKVVSAAGVTVVCNNNFAGTGVTPLYFSAYPEWKGLEINLNGHYISTTPPR